MATALIDQKLAGVPVALILDQYLSDQSTATIAARYGATRQALGQYLLKHAEKDWKEAQVARAIARKERAEDRIEEIQAIASEPPHAALDEDGEPIYQHGRPVKVWKSKDEVAQRTLSLACARDELKAAQWDLERVCRRIYGADAPISIQINALTVDDTLGLSAAGLLDKLKCVSVVAPQHIAPQHDELVDTIGKSEDTSGSGTDCA